MREPIFTSRDGSTLYVRLPPTLQRPCGDCSCDFCKAHPDLTPMWDTLALAREPRSEHEHTWTVHFPDLVQQALPFRAPPPRRGRYNEE